MGEKNFKDIQVKQVKKYTAHLKKENIIDFLGGAFFLNYAGCQLR